MTACQPSGPSLPGTASDPLVDVAVNANVGLSDNTIQVPASIAANVCGVDVNALTQEANKGSTPTCTATSSSSLDQLQPYAKEGQLQPTAQQSTPQQQNAPQQQSAPQQQNAPQQSAPSKSEGAPKNTQ
jgi:hypothetical protein